MTTRQAMTAKVLRGVVGCVLLVAIAACGDDAGGAGGAGGGATTAPASTGATTSSGGEGGAGEGGGGDPGSTGSGGEGGALPVCEDARALALGPVDAVSEGLVDVLDEADGAATVFVDASAGGMQEQASNPWIYVDLGERVRVDVTDDEADADTGWDLALKRPVLRVNGGDGGLAGEGRAAQLDVAFDDVGADDVEGATWRDERWFDAACELRTDPTGAIATSFDGWYLYEDMTVTPAPGTWLVTSGDGARIFKLAFLDYYANPDGTHGQAGGRYLLRIAEVTP